MRERIIPVLWLMTAAIIIGASVGLAARAEAAPVEQYSTDNANAICKALAERPYLSTVRAVLDAIVLDTGWSDYDAGVVLGGAVREHCPWNLGTLSRFIATYAHQATPAGRHRNGVAA
ncbi:MAG: DUF732 domain-containing protein [Mycobacterium sp.]